VMHEDEDEVMLDEDGNIIPVDTEIEGTEEVSDNANEDLPVDDE